MKVPQADEYADRKPAALGPATQNREAHHSRRTDRGGTAEGCSCERRLVVQGKQGDEGFGRRPARPPEGRRRRVDIAQRPWKTAQATMAAKTMSRSLGHFAARGLTGFSRRGYFWGPPRWTIRRAYSREGVPMKHRFLGSSGLLVSRIALGTLNFGAPSGDVTRRKRSPS